MKRKQTDTSWFRPDNAARVFETHSGTRLITVFRFSAVLKEPIHVDHLQKALEDILPRFPYFAVKLYKAAFWSCFEPNPVQPKVVADTRYPCQGLNIHRKDAFPFQVSAYYKRISVEFAHIITDGNGAIQFLRALVGQYLSLKGVSMQHPGDLMRPGQTPHPEEAEDAFHRYWKKGILKPRPKERAFHLPHAIDQKGHYHITTATLSVAALRALAKTHQVTMTNLLVGVFVQSFQQILKELPPSQYKHHCGPICVDVPVNLRAIYPSKTLRNFFVSVHPMIDPRLGWYEPDEIRKTVHHQMHLAVQEKELSRAITRNVSSEKNPFYRTIPRFLKGHVMAQVYRRMSLRATTSSLSNMGRVTMPDELDGHIDKFELVPLYPNTRRISCACISYHDKLVITFGRTLIEPIVEKYFFRTLAEQGCHVKIESDQV
jgi:hypothetical protein